MEKCFLIIYSTNSSCNKNNTILIHAIDYESAIEKLRKNIAEIYGNGDWLYKWRNATIL